MNLGLAGVWWPDLPRWRALESCKELMISFLDMFDLKRLQDIWVEILLSWVYKSGIQKRCLI